MRALCTLALAAIAATVPAAADVPIGEDRQQGNTFVSSAPFGAALLFPWLRLPEGIQVFIGTVDRSPAQFRISARMQLADGRFTVVSTETSYPGGDPKYSITTYTPGRVARVLSITTERMDGDRETADFDR